MLKHEKELFYINYKTQASYLFITFISFQHQPHKRGLGCYFSNITTYHITFLSTQCMLTPHAGLDHPLVDKLCKYHLLSLYIVRG